MSAVGNHVKLWWTVYAVTFASAAGGYFVPLVSGACALPTGTQWKSALGCALAMGINAVIHKLQDPGPIDSGIKNG